MPRPALWTALFSLAFLDSWVIRPTLAAGDAAPPANSTNATRPNIVLFLADDMGWGDLGANVPGLPSDTPHLDRLLASAAGGGGGGVLLRDFHAGSSVCSPARAALLTGRLGPRTGMAFNFGQRSAHGLAQSEALLPELLRAAGYATYMVGWGWRGALCGGS